MSEITLTDDRQLQDWIDRQMQDGRNFLLAHCDDGVIWGRRTADGLLTSHQIAPSISPRLRLTTLQQLFVFGEDETTQNWCGEARLWRGERSWEESLVTKNPTTDYLDEDQVLWGTEVIPLNNSQGFTRVREKQQQGMEQIVPITVTPQQLEQRRLKFRVRHFIERDRETGEARIYLSRLITVFVSTEDEQ
jgi:CRISPR-associated protein (TIGR03984 family)